MIWICAAIYVILTIFGKAINGKWLNLLSVFCGFYAITIILAGLRLTGINKASADTCLLMIVGVISFACGYTFLCAVKQKNLNGAKLQNNLYMDCSDENSNDEFGIRSVRKRVAIIALILVLAYSFYRLYVLLTLLKSGYSYGRVRAIYFNSQTMLDSSVANKYGRNKLDIYLIQPLLVATIILSCINFFNNGTIGFSRKGSTRYLIVTFFSVGLTAISNGGREIVFYAVLIFAFCHGIMKQKVGNETGISLALRQKRMLKVLAVLAVITLAIMTFKRSKTGESSILYFWGTIYRYFTGYIPHLNYRLQNMDSSNYTHGYAFILGLIKFPAAVLHRVVGLPVSRSYSIAEAITSQLQSRVDIGGGYSFNAYVSPFYYFFYDFGYLSLIFESMLFGGICATCEKNFESKPTVFGLFLYLFCFCFCSDFT